MILPVLIWIISLTGTVFGSTGPRLVYLGNTKESDNPNKPFHMNPSMRVVGIFTTKEMEDFTQKLHPEALRAHLTIERMKALEGSVQENINTRFSFLAQAQEMSEEIQKKKKKPTINAKLGLQKLQNFLKI